MATSLSRHFPPTHGRQQPIRGAAKSARRLAGLFSALAVVAGIAIVTAHTRDVGAPQVHVAADDASDNPAPPGEVELPDVRPPAINLGALHATWLPEGFVLHDEYDLQAGDGGGVVHVIMYANMTKAQALAGAPDFRTLIVAAASDAPTHADLQAHAASRSGRLTTVRGGKEAAVLAQATPEGVRAVKWAEYADMSMEVSSAFLTEDDLLRVVEHLDTL